MSRADWVANEQIRKHTDAELRKLDLAYDMGEISAEEYGRKLDALLSEV